MLLFCDFEKFNSPETDWASLRKSKRSQRLRRPPIHGRMEIAILSTNVRKKHTEYGSFNEWHKYCVGARVQADFFEGKLDTVLKTSILRSLELAEQGVPRPLAGLPKLLRQANSRRRRSRPLCQVCPKQSPLSGCSTHHRKVHSCSIIRGTRLGRRCQRVITGKHG